MIYSYESLFRNIPSIDVLLYITLYLVYINMHLYLNDEFARALKESRRSRGLSQRALSKLVGIPQSQIARIENGKVDPRISSAIRLARALGLELMFVPRESAQAVNSAVLNTRRKTASWATRDEWMRLLNTVQTRLAEDAEQRQYVRIYSRLHELLRFSDSGAPDMLSKKELQEWTRRVMEGLEDEELRQWAVYLDELRSNWDTKLLAELELDRMKPAYDLEALEED